MISTLTCAWRITDSATLPMSKRSKPLRPWVPSTTRSGVASAQRPRISLSAALALRTRPLTCQPESGRWAAMKRSRSSASSAFSAFSAAMASTHRRPAVGRTASSSGFSTT